MNKSDQKMMQQIMETLPKDPRGRYRFADPKRDEARLHIFDARPKIAAIGQKVGPLMFL